MDNYLDSRRSHDEAFRIYHRNLKRNYNSNDEWVVRKLEWDRSLVENYDLMLRQYQDKYELTQKQ